MKLLIIILPLVLLASCVQKTRDRTTADLGGFCGFSTNASCAADSDCKIGGCSAQVCEGASESTITTCEYRECYDANAYNVKCGCVSGQCKWYK